MHDFLSPPSFALFLSFPPSPKAPCQNTPLCGVWCLGGALIVPVTPPRGGGGASRSQSAPHMQVLVCMCSNVRQFLRYCVISLIRLIRLLLSLLLHNVSSWHDTEGGGVLHVALVFPQSEGA